jgi:hypothetical protein
VEKILRRPQPVRAHVTEIGLRNCLTELRAAHEGRGRARIVLMSESIHAGPDRVGARRLNAQTRPPSDGVRLQRIAHAYELYARARNAGVG